MILDMEAPKVNAYSLESSIAEKLEAIVKNGFLNSRYKDFYDIYVLSEKYPFNYEELNNAVTETFTNRKTPITMDTAAFSDEFLNDTMHQTRWNSFLKNNPFHLLLCRYRVCYFSVTRQFYEEISSYGSAAPAASSASRFPHRADPLMLSGGTSPLPRCCLFHLLL